MDQFFAYKSLTVSDEHGEKGVMERSAPVCLKKAGVLASMFIIVWSYLCHSHVIINFSISTDVYGMPHQGL